MPAVANETDTPDETLVPTTGTEANTDAPATQRPEAFADRRSVTETADKTDVTPDDAKELRTLAAVAQPDTEAPAIEDEIGANAVISAPTVEEPMTAPDSKQEP